MIFQPLKDFKNKVQLLELWNRENHTRFFIRKDLFESSILNSKHLEQDISTIILNEKEPVGFILVKIIQDDILYKKEAFISLVYINKEYRNQGLGFNLFENVLVKLKNLGISKIHLGKGIDPLFCGVPVENTNHEFFEKIGFKKQGISTDLHLGKASFQPLELRKKIPYNIKVATIEDFPKLESFFIENFPGRWLYEFTDYMQKGYKGDEFVIITIGEDIIGFCRVNSEKHSVNMHNTNWSKPFSNLYGVGPLGIAKYFQSNSLGYDITAFAVNLAFTRGASDIIIDWTSKVDFYKKLGFSTYQNYISYTFEITR